MKGAGNSDSLDKNCQTDYWIPPETTVICNSSWRIFDNEVFQISLKIKIIESEQILFLFKLC